MAYTNRTIGNVFFVRWDNPEASDAKSVAREVKKARQECGSPLVMVAIMPPETRAPTPAVRDAFMQALNEVMSHCCMNFLVITGNGMYKTLIRTVAMTMAMVSGFRERSFCVDDVSQALLRAERHLTQDMLSIANAATLEGFR